MRIISKYKDYYDYFTGIYGIDNNRVYKRKSVLKREPYTEPFNPEREETTWNFYICGKQYRIYEFKGNLYHTPEEIEELNNIINECNTSKYSSINDMSWETRGKPNQYELIYNRYNDVPTDLNIKQRQPVLINKKIRWESDDYMIPLLSDWDFHKVLDPKEIYIQIETFLGWLVDNPPLPDKQTNIGKIVSHGFDKKTSFRPNMKN